MIILGPVTFFRASNFSRGQWLQKLIVEACIISLILFRYVCVIQYVASKIDFSFFLNNTSDGSYRNC